MLWARAGSYNVNIILHLRSSLYNYQDIIEFILKTYLILAYVIYVVIVFVVGVVVFVVVVVVVRERSLFQP